ncbi:DUF2780 domain-containing protein [Nitrosomonas oligotropha]|uniref:DUF2780 domain-containing protein n=1 Tax=Nitrosomonas oligotropha TaxID=42354 RepID=UPI000D4D1944|nr:DUF2780 domain-containing protein [Nitrosomonas oligotropha]MXS81640.1 DUF2780 domain-containing protein [Nitrosomonas oligotropha]
MKKSNYVQLGAVIILTAMTGCATNPGGTNPVGAVNQSLSTIENAAQSGKQVLNAGAAVAGNAEGAAQIGLVDILAHRLGVSPQQALGGAGAIFQMAQSNMNPQAFSSLSRSVPGMNTMLGAAPAMSNLSALAGGNSTLGSAAALAASFQQLNLSPDMVGKFIPVITNYVSKTSGQATANLLQSALTSR